VIQAWHIVIVIVIVMAGRVQRMAGAPGSETFRRQFQRGNDRRRTKCFVFPPDSFKVEPAD
jgi:hypothetical protein